MTKSEDLYLPSVCSECKRGLVAQRLHAEEDRIMQAIVYLAVELVAEGGRISPLVGKYAPRFRELFNEFDALPDMIVESMGSMMHLEHDLSTR